MKFLSLITFASFALATPLRRQQTVTGTIEGSIDTLQKAITANTNAINEAVLTIKDNVGAEAVVKAQAAIKANYQAIAQALTSATQTIVGVTTGAAGGVIGQAQGLTQQQIVQLTKAVQSVIDSLEDIGATISVTATDLTPEVRAVFQSEIDAVKAALNPFIKPFILFAQAVTSLSVGGSVAITGLNGVLVNLIRVQNDLVKSIGLPPLTGI
ncbi:hypothetical protein NW762_002879 [Fusarium torreyae]|uniref:Uncharacterized protein n=1 Tax=Fusarium torreyae TaxID=1237075 RepID=A0A9W8SBF7_9HYPO|nr:hypothetical protein NW762_002879 [Fusarium torreyae]